MPRRVVKLPLPPEPEPLTVIWVKDFHEDATHSFARDLGAIRNQRQAICPVIIDSPGGDPYSLRAMMDLLDAYEGTVATVAMGKAMSCGAALFTCGDPGFRFMAPSATLMFHDIRDDSPGGKVEDQKASSKESQRLNNALWRRIAKNIGQPPSYLLDLVKQRSRVDWYMNAREAVRLGIASHVGLPIFEVTIRVDPFLGIQGREG
jgi:ATP-dependent protease ClpP protease subunit